MYIKSNLKKYVPVCRQYLSTYPADVDLLWEVEGVGGPYQKVKVASKLASMTLQCKYLSWLKVPFTFSISATDPLLKLLTVVGLFLKMSAFTSISIVHCKWHHTIGSISHLYLIYRLDFRFVVSISLQATTAHGQQKKTKTERLRLMRWR